MPTRRPAPVQLPRPLRRATTRGQAAFDKAVTCDGKTITFNLNGPYADFNYTVTLGLARPKAADTGETYGTVRAVRHEQRPVQGRELHDRQRRQDGPRPQRELGPGERRLRKAYPDRWVVHFGIDPKISTSGSWKAPARMSSRSSTARSSRENLGVIFADTETTAPEFAVARSAASTRTRATTGSTSTRSRTSRSARPWPSLLIARPSGPEHRWRVRRRLTPTAHQAEHRRGLRR